MYFLAGRYVALVVGMGWEKTAAREKLGLPHQLASAINQTMLTTENGLRVSREELQKYLEYCLWCYRDYFREASRKYYERKRNSLAQVGE